MKKLVSLILVLGLILTCCAAAMADAIDLEDGNGSSSADVYATVGKYAAITDAVFYVTVDWQITGGTYMLDADYYAWDPATCSYSLAEPDPDAIKDTDMADVTPYVRMTVTNRSNAEIHWELDFEAAEPFTDGELCASRANEDVYGDLESADDGTDLNAADPVLTGAPKSAVFSGYINNLDFEAATPTNKVKIGTVTCSISVTAPSILE